MKNNIYDISKKCNTIVYEQYLYIITYILWNVLNNKILNIMNKYNVNYMINK